MAQRPQRPLNESVLDQLDKAARRALGDRILQTAKRTTDPGGIRVEFAVLCASTKLVYPLGGREFSVHTAIWRSATDITFIEGEYGLTFEAAVESYAKR